MKTEIEKFNGLAERRLVLIALINEYTSKGLGNCQNVAELKKELAAINFDRYKDKYPSYIFFTDEAFDEIVKRNKLTISNIENYTGHIPNSCFEIVKTENIKEWDFREDVYYMKFRFICFEYNNSNEMIISASLTKKEHMYVISEKDSALIARFIVEKIYGSWDVFGPKLYGEKYLNHTFNYSNLYKTSLEFKTIDHHEYEGLFIAAPDIHIKKSNIEKIPLISKVFPAPVQKDPIIFRYVKDGILVITFWE